MKNHEPWLILLLQDAKAVLDPTPRKDSMLPDAWRIVSMAPADRMRSTPQKPAPTGALVFRGRLGHQQLGRSERRF